MADTFFKHPTALVGTDQIGEQTNVWAHAHVMKGASLGRHGNIGDHAFIESGAIVGDEVIVPGNTFIATALAVSALGAVPVLVDCDPVTSNIDVNLVRPVISKKTRAICPVHLYG